MYVQGVQIISSPGYFVIFQKPFDNFVLFLAEFKYVMSLTEMPGITSVAHLFTEKFDIC